jgi:hypothetical protein
VPTWRKLRVIQGQLEGNGGGFMEKNEGNIGEFRDNLEKCSRIQGQLAGM